MDLKKFEMQETGFLHLKDANDELMYADDANGNPDPTKPMRVELFGPGSKEYARAQGIRNGRQLDRARRGKKAEGSPGEQLQDSVDVLVGCTKSLENIDGEPRDLYSNQKLSFIRDQIFLYLNETSNFTKASSKS